MNNVDFSYITPRYLEDLQPSVLWQTVEQYRLAADLLRRNPVRSAPELRTELLHAIDLLEAEMERRVKQSTSENYRHTSSPDNVTAT